MYVSGPDHKLDNITDYELDSIESLRTLDLKRTSFIRKSSQLHPLNSSKIEIGILNRVI